jgi:tripartite-type tricarboxylate transporter receptor subunit TctC
MTPMPRILAAIAASLFAAAGMSAQAAAQAAAQAYPNKPVRVVVGFAPGGPTDVIARILSQKLSENLGQQFVVENRVGAGGNIAMGLVAKASPDGYTVLVVSSAFVVNPSLYGKNITYDAYKDFEPITNFADSPNLMVVNPSVPAKTAKELIDVVKANPGKYSFATAGIGTTPDLAGEMFRMTFNLDMVRVPFNGAAPALASTLQGQTPIAFSAMPPATEMVKAGQLRGLAVASAKRSPALPDVPTFAEGGIAGQESNTLQGVFVPAGTPHAIVDRLYRESVKILQQPDIQTRLATLGFQPIGNSPAEFAAQIKTEIARWEKVIKAAGIKVE